MTWSESVIDVYLVIVTRIRAAYLIDAKPSDKVPPSNIVNFNIDENPAFLLQPGVSVGLPSRSSVA